MTIFVATGTTGFDALAEAMDVLSATMAEAVTIQIGAGTYVPRRAGYFRFAPSLEPHYHRADLVVAHGGLGICTEVLRLGKPLIGVAAADRYDNHQEDLLFTLERLGHMLFCRRLGDLEAAIRQARTTRFQPYVRPETTIHLHIRKYLDGIERR